MENNCKKNRANIDNDIGFMDHDNGDYVNNRNNIIKGIHYEFNIFKNSDYNDNDNKIFNLLCYIELDYNINTENGNRNERRRRE